MYSHYFSRLFVRLILFLLLQNLAMVARSVEVRPIFKKSVLFKEQTDGYTLYRIPGIVVTRENTILAYCEGRKFRNADRGEIEILMRRSTDRGKTFSPPFQVAHLGPRLPRNPVLPPGKEGKDMGGPDEQTVNNPVAIATHSGRIHLVYCVEYMRCFIIHSDDDGKTWSSPREITKALDTCRSVIDWQAIATGPGHGIELTSKRLVVPIWLADYRPTRTTKGVATTLVSDDGGTTWSTEEISMIGGGEANVVELSDGSVMLTTRNGDPRQRRLVSFSDDGGTGWSSPDIIKEIKEPGCMAGVTSLRSHTGEDAAILFSNVQVTKRKHSARKNLTIHVSHDDGMSWSTSKTIEPGPSAYSDLAVLDDGTILCFYESGIAQPKIKRNRDWAYANLTLARFNLAWIKE